MVVRAAVLALAMLLIAAPAYACPVLKKADPKVGSTVEGSVTSVTLSFSGHVYPAQSTVTVTDRDGRNVVAGKPYGNDKTVAVRLKPLPPGKYKVAWNVWCDCGSFTPGDYAFTVR